MADDREELLALRRMAELEAKAGAATPQRAASPMQAPSAMDYARTSVVGAPLQTLYRGGQGIEQLIARALALASDLGGLAPNPVSRGLRELSGAVDKNIAEQNQGYEDAKSRVIAASSNPRAQGAFTNTFEIMGNLLNPAGMVGGGLTNPIARGAASASGFAASQPVTDPESNFWGEKAKQQAVAVPLGAAMGAATATRAPKPPTAKDLKQQATEAYTAARESGATVPKGSLLQMLDDTEAAARKDLTYRPATHPKAATALGLMREELGQAGDNLTLDDVEVMRRIASSALESSSKGDRAVAHRVIDGIDDFVGGLDDNFAQARGLYARSAKSATLERLQDKAKNAVGANYTTAGYETALRQQFKSLANNERAFRRFNSDERDAILKVVRGGPIENALRMVGRLAVRGPVSGAPTAAALLSGQPEVAAGLAMAGEAGRMGATQMGIRNVRLADELVRRGASKPSVPGPGPDVPVGSLPTALLLETLLRQQRVR